MNLSMTNFICNNMKQLVLIVLLITLLPISESFGQCAVDVNLGQNQVVNGDFSQGYTGWTYTPDSDGDLNTPPGSPDGYKVFTGGFSVPGNIYVGTGADMYGFNNAFNQPFNGHTTGAANDKFLMVDGVCVVGIKLFSQSNIPVIPNTRYYFSIWINSLKDQPNYPGILNFDVNGTNLATGIIAPAIGGGNVGGAWRKVEAFWDSGIAPPTTVTISIKGNQTIGCGGNSGESDFAIDDVSFIPGCGYSDNGPIPNLGADRTICGTGGSITLDSNVPHTDSTLVTWSANTPGINSGFGLGAPYSKVITAPGTYSVCVTAGNACTKSDIIVVSSTFTPNRTPDADLCGIPTAPLDAVFTGIGVTYQWKLNGSNLPAPSTNRTYGATTVGAYTVDVTVLGCGTVTSGTTTITSSATAAPTTSPGADLCKTNPVPLDAVLTGTGITYQWKRDGVNLPTPSTNKTYTATSTGTYTVDVKLPGCTTTTSGNTVITSNSSITPTNAFYCATGPIVDPITLKATGTNSATFNWYTTLNGVTSFNTGSSYTFTPPVGTTGDITYYVEDNTITNGTVGPTTKFTTGSASDLDAGNVQGNQYGVNFTTTQDFTLNSLQIPIRVTNGKAGTPMVVTSIKLRVYLDNNATPGSQTSTSLVFTSTSAPVTIAGGGANVAVDSLYTFSFTNFDIPISLGTKLALKIETISTVYETWRYKVGGRTGLTNPYPYASTITPNPVTIVSSSLSNSKKTDAYFSLYNWNISAKTPCSRTPVVAINNCVTPVTWTSFYLVPQNNACKLVWNTAEETNNAYFVVERSTDGINFESIATLSGAGNRDIASNYYYIDNAPVSGNSYYRITQHDYDGKSSSTAMQPYSSESFVKVTIYPNPFQNNTTLLVNGSNASTYTYMLYSVSGQLVEQGSGTMNQAQSIGEALAKGMYMLTVLTSTDIVTSKIVKQ